MDYYEGITVVGGNTFESALNDGIPTSFNLGFIA
jgi:hypothetical protein